MGYVIQRTDQGGGYVARPGSRGSYTGKLQEARVYPTRQAAEADRCVENERVLSVDEAIR